MSLSSWHALRRWKAAFAGAVGVTALAPVLAVAPASAQATPACTAFPVADLTPGLVASGLTVNRGTVPEPFTATVVGVIDDGIAAGLDMIIVETDSPAIQSAGGVWAGMSGSPVYAPDGRLIGAVAYGLSFSPSRIAGVTPAADMLELLARPGAAAALSPTAEVALPSTLKQRVVASGAATAVEAASGMQRLPLPLGVSGVNPGHLDEVANRLQKSAPETRVYAAGAAAIGAAAAPADIFPGSNFAAAISSGDFTAVGVGTTTAVCDGVALAFGHPFLFTGTSSMGVHTADAVFVQPNLLGGPFKVANPGGVVGILDQDRLAGIRGQFDRVPGPLPIESSVTSTDPGGGSRTATTQVNLPDFVADVAFIHMLNNFDRVFDRIGGGVADLRWIIEGTRASGAPFTVNVRNKYASPFDVSFEAVIQPADQLFALTTNSHEAAKINRVGFTGSIDSDFTNYTIESVLVRLPNGQFVPAPTDHPLQVVTGSRLNLRVKLRPYRESTLVDADLSVVVPPGTAGAVGSVDIVGGPGDVFPEEPASFDELLAQLRGVPPNDSVNATLRVERETSAGVATYTRTARKIVDKVVAGFESFPIEVVAPRRARPGVVDGNTWKLRSSLSSGPPTTTFAYGRSTDLQLMGDWDGNGTLTPAVFRDGTWYVRRTSLTGTVTALAFGQAGDIPVSGDWDGDGDDTIGVFRGGRWLLRNALSSGPADLDFIYGPATWRPVTGDWDGDGRDSIGVFRIGNWSLRNSNSAGPASYEFIYGTTGDRPVVGEWDLDGRDEIGVYRQGRWLLRDSLTSGPTSRSFTFGGTTSRPVVWG
ncbi:MAG TPA: SpoIVB peptidase S55 domain-containing protein [Jiangellaceae bacterium]|nr:SpoIVB peptidase S55 domain-containing protein [Jiangellaceae bacterium]